MQLHELPTIVRRKRRRGRGIAGHGAKSGRGMKGQRSRAGSRQKAGFEGGQTPLYMRLPKGRGTKQRFSSQVVKPVALPVSSLRQFAAGSIVGPGQLRKAGLVHRRRDRVKLIAAARPSGRGSQEAAGLDRKLTVRVHAATAAATKQVSEAGGSVEIITTGS